MLTFAVRRQTDFESFQNRKKHRPTANVTFFGLAWSQSNTPESLQARMRLGNASSLGAVQELLPLLLRRVKPVFVTSALPSGKARAGRLAIMYGIEIRCFPVGSC